MDVIDQKQATVKYSASKILSGEYGDYLGAKITVDGEDEYLNGNPDANMQECRALGNLNKGEEISVLKCRTKNGNIKYKMMESDIKQIAKRGFPTFLKNWRDGDDEDSDESSQQSSAPAPVRTFERWNKDAFKQRVSEAKKRATLITQIYAMLDTKFDDISGVSFGEDAGEEQEGLSMLPGSDDITEMTVAIYESLQ